MAIRAFLEQRTEEGKACRWCQGLRQELAIGHKVGAGLGLCYEGRGSHRDRRGVPIRAQGRTRLGVCSYGAKTECLGSSHPGGFPSYELQGRGVEGPRPVPRAGR